MPRSDEGRPEDRLIPFGYNKGIPLGKVSDKELRSLREWCAEKDDEAGTRRFDDLIAVIDEVVENRQGLPLGLDD
jgi:hypothetical protein